MYKPNTFSFLVPLAEKFVFLIMLFLFLVLRCLEVVSTTFSSSLSEEWSSSSCLILLSPFSSKNRINSIHFCNIDHKAFTCIPIHFCFFDVFLSIFSVLTKLFIFIFTHIILGFALTLVF